MSAFDVLWRYRQAFLAGMLTTAELLVISAITSTIVAVALEWLCGVGGRRFRRTVDALAFGTSAIPALVVLFWFHYPAQAILGVVVDPFWTALFTLTLLDTLAVYRIVADAIRDLPQQFVSTGLVCGLTESQIARFIKAPLIVRAALPRWIDQQVLILQTSVFASLISVNEIFRAAQRINAREYQPVTIYTAMAILFLLTAGTAMYGARRLRLKYYRDFSER